MPLFEFIPTTPWVLKSLQSGLCILIIFLLRFLADFGLQRATDRSAEWRLRWKIFIRNFSVVVLLIGLLLIWEAELKTLALSLVAVAVALIIATKELIMCFTGSLFKTTAGAFSIGDRIIAGEFRGEVIDQTLLSTTLMEIGPGKDMHQLTGRAITLPNSLFVTIPVINESYRQNYVLHGFSVPIKLDANFRQAMDLLHSLAQDVCKPYLLEAERQLITTARLRSVDVPSIEPKVSLSLIDAENASLLVRVPAPVRRRGRIEQEIIQKFLSQYLAEGASQS